MLGFLLSYFINFCQGFFMGIKEDFLKACQDGDIDIVQRLIQHHYHPKKWSRGFRQLTGKEIDLNIVSPDGSTPLMLAAGNGYTNIVELLIPLLDATNLNAINKNNFSALMLATKNNHIQTIVRAK
jgi:ankyrin repeat protein